MRIIRVMDAHSYLNCSGTNLVQPILDIGSKPQQCETFLLLKKGSQRRTVVGLIGKKWKSQLRRRLKVVDLKTFLPGRILSQPDL